MIQSAKNILNKTHSDELFEQLSQFNAKIASLGAKSILEAIEEKKFDAQLGNILGYIEKLKGLDIANVEPTAHATPMANVMRHDEARPSLPHDDAMRNAPAKANGLFIVPKIVE